MLHTKFRGNQSSREEVFLRAFTIYGCGGHLGHVTSIMSSDFHFLVPESFQIKFGSKRHSHLAGDVLWVFVEPGNVVP